MVKTSKNSKISDTRSKAEGFDLLAEKIKEIVEHAGDTEENPKWLPKVAMLTGVLAAVSGYLAIHTTSLTNDAIYESNLAILAQTESSDAWNEYQADSIKAHIAETALNSASPTLPTQQRDLIASDANDIRSRQPQIKQNALDKTKERDAHLKDGLAHLAEKDILSYSELAAQIGIGLASVAALVRIKTAFHLAIALGGISIMMLIYALATQYGVAPTIDQLAPIAHQASP